MAELYEAAAQLAAYGYETYDSRIMALAGELVKGEYSDPAPALDKAHSLSQGHRGTFEEWQDRQDVPAMTEARVELQENYARYAGPAWSLRLGLARPIGLLSLGPFRRGSRAAAMLFNESDGNRVVAKVPLGEWEGGFRRSPVTIADGVYFTEDRIRHLPKIHPNINFEQLRAASYAGQVISTCIPGRQMYKLTSVELEAVTDDHLLKAVEDLTVLAKAGVRQDGNSANTHFDPAAGFGFFDPLEYGASLNWALWSNIHDLGKGLMDTDASPKRSRTPECLALRKDLLCRLKTLAPQAPAEAQPHINGLDNL
jgi:hypothetical protein